MTNAFVLNMIVLHASKAKQYYYLCSVLGGLFEPASYTIMFYVFYTVIHIFRGNVSGKHITKERMEIFSITKYMHWAIVGLFAILVIIDWSWMIVWRNSLVHDEIVFARQKEVWNKLDSARCILFWLAAWEIVGWGFYLGLMISRDPSKVKLKVSII